MKWAIFYLIFISLMATCFSEDKVKMGVLTFAANEKLVEQQIAEKIVKKIYEKLNLSLRVEALPPLRAKTKNLQGRIDGEIARIHQYGVNNPSLIRVEPSYYQITSSAFCLDPEKIHITNLKELKKYKLAVIRGVAHSEVAAKDIPETLVINDGLQMYDLLLNGRVDVAIDTGINGKKIIKMKRYGSIKNCGNFARYQIYNYLNKRSAKYKAPLSAMIKKLRDSGELERMIHEAEEEFLAK